MSLDKAIAHGKEKRKPYRGSKAIDCTCRNHGSCQWCVENRTHKFRDKEDLSVRIETKYFAFDEEEFDTEEECKAYEDNLMGNFKAVAFFDEDLKPITSANAEYINGYAMFMKILDAEKAEELFHWLYSYCGFDADGLSRNMKTGDIYAWDNDDGVWYKLAWRLTELQKTVDAIEKAVNSVG